jgi:hypothetical protein
MPKLALRLLEPIFATEMAHPTGKALGISEFPDRDIVNVAAAMVVADCLVSFAKRDYLPAMEWNIFVNFQHLEPSFTSVGTEGSSAP